MKEGEKGTLQLFASLLLGLAASVGTLGFAYWLVRMYYLPEGYQNANVLDVEGSHAAIPADTEVPITVVNFLHDDSEGAPFTRNRARQERLALQLGASRVEHYNMQRLQTSLGEEDGQRVAEFIQDNPRGAGYWTWKPIIIADTLATLKEDEVLIYMDCGSFARKPLRGLADRTAGSSTGIVVMTSVYPVASTVRADVGEHVSGRSDFCKVWADRPSIQATIVVIRKTPASEEIIKQWAKLAVNDPWLFTDNFKPCGAGFLEHRHDQAVLQSLLLARDDSGSFMVHPSELL